MEGAKEAGTERVQLERRVQPQVIEEEGGIEAPGKKEGARSLTKVVEIGEGALGRGQVL
jgi:hypothetical protein